MTSLQVCVQDFCEELEYWALDDLHLEPCCQHTYYRARYVTMSHSGHDLRCLQVAAAPEG